MRKARSLFEGDADDRVRAPAAQAPADPPSKATEERRLRARISVRPSGEIVLLVDVDALLSWTVPSTAEVTWSDGRVTTVAIAADRSTRDGSVAAGQTLRLVLLTTETADPRTITLQMDALRLVLDL
jgi:hypothetical protein